MGIIDPRFRRSVKIKDLYERAMDAKRSGDTSRLMHLSVQLDDELFGAIGHHKVFTSVDADNEPLFEAAD